MLKNTEGFIAGRYETGEGETVVKGVNPLVNKTWYELYQINKNMINTNGIKSSMIWGSQWDQTMIWFHTQGEEKAESAYKKDYVYDSTKKGYYPEESKTTITGLDPKYAVNNIYDMAGNAWDWTLEARKDSYRSIRGRRLLRF